MLSWEAQLYRAYDERQAPALGGRQGRDAMFAVQLLEGAYKGPDSLTYFTELSDFGRSYRLEVGRADPPSGLRDATASRRVVARTPRACITWHVHVLTHVHMRVRVYPYTHTYTYTYIYMYVCMHVNASRAACALGGANPRE